MYHNENDQWYYNVKRKNHLRKIGGKYCHKGSKLNNEALSQSSSFECL